MNVDHMDRITLILFIDLKIQVQSFKSSEESSHDNL